MEYLTNPVFFITIIKKVENYISRSLTDEEENKIINLIKNTNLENINNMSKQKISHLLIETIIEDLNLKYHAETVNIHELMLNEINNKDDTLNNVTNQIAENYKSSENDIRINSIFGINNITQLTKIISEMNKQKEDKEYIAYLLLDSRYRFLENDGTEYFKWGCINNYIRSQGTINHNGVIKNIKAIELAKFVLPNNLTKKICKYNRLTTLIHEFESQSFIGHEDRRFHFMSQPELSNNKISIDPHYFHNGIFKFKDPITILDTLTISFGNPLEKIKFDKDRLDGKFIIEDIDNKNILYIQFNENHNIKSGEYIYIDTFDKKIQNTHLKNNCDYINLIKIINNNKGLQCYIKDSTSIYLFKSDYDYIDENDIEVHKNNFIDIDDTIKNKIDLNSKYNVFFGSKRIFLTLSLTYSL